jgi:hypothetical protein
VGGDINSGLYSTGADQVAISTNGTGRLFIDASGRVGLGTSSPATTLDVNGDVTITDKIIHGGDTNTAIRFPAADTVSVETAGSERARIDSSGRLLIGTSSDLSGGDADARLQVNGDAGAQILLSRQDFGGLTAGTLIGEVVFRSQASGVSETSALIKCEADATQGSGDKPGRLVFSTTADGASSPTERMRIDQAGRIGVNVTPATNTRFDLSGTYAQTIVAVGALNIDCSTGNYFTKTINGNSTFTVSNVPSSRAYSFTLELTHTSGTITWFSGVVWPGGTAPTLTTGKVHLFMFVTDDGGTTWRASSLINY